jgi:alkylation response protein AidB-like acyl-CoA dehydrogenase
MRPTWVINGHKVWTSLAHFAEWMILLLRTDRGHKYEGLSYFVVPIAAALGKGVTVRPLIKMTGETGFNEVLFEDLEVDDSYRLDELGKGWQVAMTTLLFERGAGDLVTPRAGGLRSAAVTTPTPAR